MATSDAYIDFVCEQLAGMGAVRRRKMFGRKTVVVADDHAAVARVMMLCKILGHALRRAPHIVKRVIFGDNAAPTVRAEFNFVTHG